MAERRTPVVHTLKILPKHFAAVWANKKRAELRGNDRDYQVGDVLQLVETLPDTDMTGKSVCVRITHVADISDYAPGYVLLSIAQVWTRCGEWLPDDRQHVWCWGKFCDWAECDIFEGYYDRSEDKWWAVTDDGENLAAKVTHWMPLPEPPVNVTVKE